jgi:hypothetical protein
MCCGPVCSSKLGPIATAGAERAGRREQAETPVEVPGPADCHRRLLAHQADHRPQAEHGARRDQHRQALGGHGEHAGGGEDQPSGDGQPRRAEPVGLAADAKASSNGSAEKLADSAPMAALSASSSTAR